MIPSALAASQKGIYVALTGDSALSALLVGGDGVRDRVPNAPKYPVIVIGESVEVPDRTMGQGGHELLCDVTVYTRDGATAVNGLGSSGFKQPLAIVERVHELLVGSPAGVRTLAITGFDLIDVDVDFSQTVREPDGITRSVDIRYRVRVETQP